jgi:hypothetical protein
MEFSYLSDVTGDPKYSQKVEKVKIVVINRGYDLLVLLGQSH